MFALLLIDASGEIAHVGVNFESVSDADTELVTASVIANRTGMVANAESNRFNSKFRIAFFS